MNSPLGVGFTLTCAGSLPIVDVLLDFEHEVAKFMETPYAADCACCDSRRRRDAVRLAATWALLSSREQVEFLLDHGEHGVDRYVDALHVIADVAREDGRDAMELDVALGALDDDATATRYASP
jgi:hypothetical protein